MDDKIMRQIERRLTILYTVVVGGILTLVVLAGYVITEQERTQSQMEAFQNNVFLITNKLQSDNLINNTWLSSMETKNQCIIQIADNGNELKPHGSWVTQEKRDKLVDKVLEDAKSEGFELTTAPISYSDVRTAYYEVKDEGTKYYAVAVMIPRDSGYRTVIVLQTFPNAVSVREKQKIMYFILDLCGIFLIFLVNYFFVRKVMMPVKESKRQQTEFIAAASHELKSPLAVIRTSASAIKSLPERREHYADNIEEECERLSKLVDDLLLLSSSESKTWKIQKSPIEVDTLLLTVYEKYEQICQEQGIKLRVELPEEMLPAIEGDESRLMQVLIILLDNAITYSKSHTIKLRAYESRHYIYQEVIDYGVGIPKEKQATIFRKFYRAEESHSDKRHFGIGLSIASELIHLHGGILALDDTKGGGCTFVIKIPKLQNF